MKEELQWPTFLGIGSMRCGTTWTHRVLSCHPCIGMPTPKQTEFFNRKILTNDLTWYRERFEQASGEPPLPVRGEITPFYCRLPEPCVKSIANLLPNVKLLLSIRNPIERTWSQVVYDFAYHRKTPLDTVTPGQIIRHIDRQRTILYNDYVRMIRIWSGAFGEQALHLELYDDLCSEPVEFIRRIVSHLGLPMNWDPPADLMRTKVLSGVELVGQKGGVPDYIRWHLSKQYYDAVIDLNSLLGGKVESWLPEMDEWRNRGRVSWRARGTINRALLELPERLAYAVYSVWNGQRIVGRIARLQADSPARSESL